MNINYSSFALTLALTCVALPGCDKKEGAGKSENPLEAIKTAAGDAASKATEEVNKKIDQGFAALRDSAAEAVQKSLDEAKSKIGLLKDKTAGATAETKPAMESAIKAIEDQFAKVQAKLPELKAATSENWKSISESLTKEGSSLMDMIKGAMEKFGVK